MKFIQAAYHQFKKPAGNFSSALCASSMQNHAISYFSRVKNNGFWHAMTFVISSDSVYPLVVYPIAND